MPVDLCKRPTHHDLAVGLHEHGIDVAARGAGAEAGVEGARTRQPRQPRRRLAAHAGEGAADHELAVALLCYRAHGSIGVGGKRGVR